MNHLKESDSLYKGIQGLMKDLSDSAGDTKKYREQITKLNDNLSALNNVYGNMLSAMNVKITWLFYLTKLLTKMAHEKSYLRGKR